MILENVGKTPYRKLDEPKEWKNKSVPLSTVNTISTSIVDLKMLFVNIVMLMCFFWDENVIYPSYVAV